MTNIFIANLDFGITSDDLRATFSQFGEVSYAHVVYDNKTKKSKGYGYVEMENLSEANAAIGAVNGRVLDVKLATPKDKRPQNMNKPKEKDLDKERFKPKSRTREVKEVKTSERRVLRPRRKRTGEDNE